MTASVRSLGYVRVGCENIGEWSDFATKVLGVQVVPHTDKSIRLRQDMFLYRWEVTEGEPVGVHTLGWEVKDADALNEVIARVEKYGYNVTHHGQGSELALARNVRDLAAFTDPDGITIELYYALASDITPFVSQTGTSFVSDRVLGLGHIFQLVSDREKYAELYFDVLGFKLSDYIGPAIFTHCNPRHHSFAFQEVKGDARQRLQGILHVMLEATDIDAVGRAIDNMFAHGAKEKATLGKHTNDKMVSFYVETPSGTQVEYGTGGILIDDEVWTPTSYSSAHFWGHDREGL